MIMDLLRWLLFIALLVFAYGHIGWQTSSILLGFFIELEFILHLLRKNALISVKKGITAERKFSNEDLSRLQFSDEPVTLHEAVLIERVVNGDLSALNEFLTARCLDKSVAFAEVPLDLLIPISERITRAINQNMNKGKSEEAVINLSKNQLIH